MHAFYAQLHATGPGRSELLARLSRLTRMTLAQIATVRTDFGWVAWG